MLTLGTVNTNFILGLTGLVAGDCIMLFGAHPDDMDVATAGLQILGARAGLRVINVVATCGGAGSRDEVRWPSHEIADIRRLEQLSAAAILGTEETIFLDYLDGQLHRADKARGITQLAELMHRYRPRLVITYGPDGLTGHLDHQAISSWTTQAFQRYGADRGELWYVAATAEWQDEIRPHLEQANAMYGAQYPDVYGPGHLVLDLELPDDTFNLKMRAIWAHFCQIQPLHEAVGDLRVLTRWFAREAYRFAA